MTTYNDRFRLPGGPMVVRERNGTGAVRYFLHGAPVVLSCADVEQLFADAISHDGGHQLPGPSPASAPQTREAWEREGRLHAELIADARARLRERVIAKILWMQDGHARGYRR